MPITIDGDGTISGISVGGLPDGIVDTDMIAADAVTAAKIGHKGFVSYAIICDQKDDGDHGGQLTGGSWLTRDLQTTIADPDSIVTIASHRFTLQAGSYLITASVPAIEVNRHQARLYDYTNTSVIQYGSSEYSGDANGYSTCRSFIEARVTPTAATAYEIQHRGRETRTSFGFGIDSAFGGKNVYTIVKIFKEA